MANPYQIPPSAFQDDPSPNLPTGLPGFSLRRSSYASVASGSGGYARSGATFAQLLNPTGAVDGSDSNSTSNNNSSSSLRAPYTSDVDAIRNGIDTADGALLRWLGSRNSQLPSFSRAFEPFVRGSGYDGYGPVPSNNGFFTPSYLRESVYVQKLEDQYKAKMSSLRESQQHQHHQQNLTNPSHPQSTASAATSAAAAAAAAASGISGSGYAGSSGAAGASLTSRGSSHSLHGNGGGTSSKFGPPSYRGMAFDVVEKVPGGAGDEETIAPLPSRWDKRDKASNLDVLTDGLDVKYTAPKASSDREQEACSIRADHYMPPQCGIYYFEVTILSKKREESTIGIGFSDGSASLQRPPGWEPKSWGYHSDDGNVFHAQNTGKLYGPMFSSGDVVGCGVNFRTGTAFYTKNGEHLGDAFRDIKGNNLKLFPTVGLKKTGEHVRVNFGQVPFTFDIDGLMKKERLAINQQIAETSTNNLAPPLNETELVQQLHDGYVETARAFAEEVQEQKQALSLDPVKQTRGVNIADDEDANNRQRIRRAVLEGDIDRALKLTNAYYPHVLKDNEDVYFRLRCRKFIEMIRREAELNLVGGDSTGLGGIGIGSVDTKQSNGHGRSNNQHQDMDIDDVVMVEDGTDSQADTRSLVDEAITFGQVLQSEYANDPRPEVRSTLGAIFALLAYSNPLKEKEVAHLLDQKGRASVAEDLNSAILQSLGKSSRAALENLYAQTSVLLDDLRQDGGPGSFVTIQSVVDQVSMPPSS